MPDRELTVTVAGPIGSGKTTLLTIIEDALHRAGVSPADIDVAVLDAATGERAHHHAQERGFGDRMKYLRSILESGKPFMQPVKVHLRTINTLREPSPAV